MYGGQAEKSPLGHKSAKPGPIWRVHQAFNRYFDKLRDFYGVCLATALDHRLAVTSAFLILVAGSGGLLRILGRDFFPSVDSGQMRLHVRTPAGTRIEETERWFGRIAQVVRGIVPPEELKTIIDNIGIPNSGINLALSDGSLMSSADGEMLIALHEHHAPTAQYVEKIRKEMNEQFPDLTFYFQPPDIVTQVLNFGLAAPVDLQIVGPRKNYEQNYQLAKRLRDRMSQIPGVVDVHLQQVIRTPELNIQADRALLSQLGISERDISSDLLVSLSSSGQASPNFWLDPKSGVQYPVAVQTPQFKIDSVAAIHNTPISRSGEGVQSQLLGNVASVQHAFGPTNVTHYNIAQTFDVLAGVQGTDLGRVSSAIEEIVREIRPSLPRGTTIAVRGQIQSMNTSFQGLSYGLIFSVSLVYLLMVVNFQSWLDPLIILMALPGAMSGILWMLFVTQTTISVPALMGSIMCIGVATANSILMVTFAKDQQLAGKNSVDAAWSAGVTRLRPVIMTALAMILGMLPMSLGLGEGGEQNAPLGRAVIGGLTLATFATLFFVPVVYSVLRRNPKQIVLEPELVD